ncbi:ATP-binding protein [Streptomyces sparsogenes]|uniref:ATP-binding protein n=1 Tax=Streptomyces sparsogenes TaxID=67365 RepID=UPI003328AE34
MGGNVSPINILRWGSSALGEFNGVVVVSHPRSGRRPPHGTHSLQRRLSSSMHHPNCTVRAPRGARIRGIWPRSPSSYPARPTRCARCRAMTLERGRQEILRWTSCTPGAAAHARAALRRTLTQLNLPGEAISDAVLAASELIANAIEHACGPYEMRLCHTDVGLTCEIQDGDPHIPNIPRSPASTPLGSETQRPGGGLEALTELLPERGRGMRIVNQLTSGRWGFRPSGSVAKVAWMAIPGSGSD